MANSDGQDGIPTKETVIPEKLEGHDPAKPWTWYPPCRWCGAVIHWHQEEWVHMGEFGAAIRKRCADDNHDAEPKVGESGLSDSQVVKQSYPNAYCDRIVGAEVVRVIIDGKGPNLSKDCSTCEEAWADARARIEAKPEPNMCEHCWNECAPVGNHGVTKEYCGLCATIRPKPEPLPNTPSTTEEACEWNGRILSNHHDLVNIHGGGSRCVKCKKEWLASVQEMPAPNTLQEKRINALTAALEAYVDNDDCVLTPDYDVNTEIRNCAHANCRWCNAVQALNAIAAPKVVDSKEEEEICANGAEKIGTCAVSAEVAQTAETASAMNTTGTISVKTNMTEAKVEEQDGEQEPMSEDSARIEKRIRAKNDMANATGEEWIWETLAVLEAEGKLAESVAPPSLPKQDTEIDVAEAIQLMQEIHGEHDRCNRYKRCACWVCSRIDVILASRAAAPVALPTHQIVSSNVVAVERSAELRCSCGRIFVGLGDEALASSRASFEAHLPEKEGK